MTGAPQPTQPAAEGDRHDVAIVGAGAVGLLLACLLAQRGLDVVVLERRAGPGPAARAFGIHPPGLAALDAAGVGAAVRREAGVIRTGVARSGGRAVATLDLARRPILALPQQRTEAILRDRLAALAPHAVRWGTEVTGIAQEADGVRLSLAGGGCVAARFAVGADGVHGRVRSLLGVGLRERRGSAGYAMADVDDAGALDAGALDAGAGDAALLHLEPAGIVESFPLPGGRRRWVVRLAHPEESVSRERLQSLLAERLRPAPTLPDDAAPSAFVARQRLADRFAVGRVALAGDAAHEVSPIGGQGMSLGWLDALALERAIVRSGAQGAASRAPFAGYDRARRRAAARAMRRAAFNMAMGAPAGRARLALRLGVARALALPPARGALVAAFTMRGL